MEQEEVKKLLEVLDNRLNELIPDVIVEDPSRSIRAEEHVRTLLMIREYLCNKTAIEELKSIIDKEIKNVG